MQEHDWLGSYVQKTPGVLGDIKLSMSQKWTS